MSNSVVRAKGQITIPLEIRTAARLEEGDPLDVQIVPEGILLRPQKVIDATQAWFWTPDWQAGEREAAAEKEEVQGQVFESSEDFLSSFDQ